MRTLNKKLWGYTKACHRLQEYIKINKIQHSIAGVDKADQLNRIKASIKDHCMQKMEK